jgi:hypothetical protein
MPTEGKSFARHHKQQFTQLLQHLKMRPKEYRIRISTLRRYLNIPENHLCTRKTHLIDPAKLTNGAKKLYNSALHNQNPWTYPLDKKKKKKKHRTKHIETYTHILNDLKLDID